MQAGTPSDTSFVSRHAGGKCRTSTLFDFTHPVSPHLAAARDGTIVPDDFLVSALVEEIKSALRHGSDGEGGGSLVLVETAGGVLSPAPSGSLQADAFRPIRLPVLLVGDGKLGGIGVTLSVLESLRTRGYSVLGVVMGVHFWIHHQMQQRSCSKSIILSRITPRRQYQKRSNRMCVKAKSVSKSVPVVTLPRLLRFCARGILGCSRLYCRHHFRPKDHFAFKKPT